jgi:hypothetical protein
MNPGVSAVVLLIDGLFTCFFGYRLLRITLGIAGFLLGAAALGGLAASLHAPAVVTLVVALVGGIGGLLLAVLLFRVGVFMLGCGAGALLAGVVSAGAAQPVPFWVLVGAGIAGGVLALLLQRPVISVLTGFSGAALAVAGLFQLLGRYQIPRVPSPEALRPAPGQFLWLALAWVVLGVAGSLVQLAGGRKQPES